MSKDWDYHTALKKGEVLDHEPCNYFESGDNQLIAGSHDINLGLPDWFSDADILYGEPPWREGMKVFYDRVGVPQCDFGDFYTRMDSIMATDSRPAIVIAGKTYSEFFKNSNYNTPIMLNGGEAVMYCYGVNLAVPRIDPEVIPSTHDLLGLLSRKFNCIADFCCGYGVAARHFMSSGKAARLSDINPICIGAIKETYKSWYD